MRKHKTYLLIIAALSLVVAIETAALVFISLRRAVKPSARPAAVKGEIAVVIDDWGYNLDNLWLLDQIHVPLTASILPNLPYSQQVAQKLKEKGFEIILHLPMEPHEKYRLEQHTIMTAMGEQQIARIIEEDILGLPGIRGVSNHMGSRATEDQRLMGAVFRELKKKNLYFLDSLVSARSVCAAVAKQSRIAFAKRDIFLDNNEDPAYIKGQLGRLKKRALANGRAIGIGHDRASTLEVLRQELPRLEKEGYRLVFVSELVR